MFKGTIYLSLSQAILIVTNLVLHIYLGRTLGPALYGIFGVMSALIIVNEVFLCKGIYETLSKYIAEMQGAARSIIKSATAAQALIGFSMGSIYFLFADQIAGLMNDPDLAVYLRLLSVIIPIVGLSTVFIGALNGLRQFGKQAVISIVFSLAKLTFVIGFVFAGFSVKGAIMGIISAELFRLIVARILCRPEKAISSIDYNKKKMVGFALQCIIVAIMASLIMNMDLIAVKVFLKDNYQTGLYTAAVTISRMLWVLMAPVSLTILPTISKSISEGDLNLTEGYIKQSMKMVLVFTLPISLLFIATSENLIILLYGDNYQAASLLFNVLISATIFFSIKVVMFGVIMASGKPRYIIYIGLLSIVVDIVLLVTLLYDIGAIGAAIASLATHFLGLMISYCYVAKRFLKQFFPVFLLRIVLASLVIFIIALSYSPTGIILIFYYIVLLSLFFIILIMLKEIDLMQIRKKLFS